MYMHEYVLQQWHKSTTLASYPARIIDPSEYAHVIVDVQNYYCNKRRLFGSQHTEDISKKIAEITPKFRDYGFKTVFVTVENEALDETAKSLYVVQTALGKDLFVEKTAEDAFTSGNLDDALKSTSSKGIVISGFNAASCIKDTVRSALERGYSVIVLSDCVGQGRQQEDTIPYHLADLEATGATLMTSEQLLLAQKIPQFESDVTKNHVNHDILAIA